MHKPWKLKALDRAISSHGTTSILAPYKEPGPGEMYLDPSWHFAGKQIEVVIYIRFKLELSGKMGSILMV